MFARLYKGNKKITELQQPENCENRNDPDLVQAFLKKWWVESDFKAHHFYDHIISQRVDVWANNTSLTHHFIFKYI